MRRSDWREVQSLLVIFLIFSSSPFSSRDALISCGHNISALLSANLCYKNIYFLFIINPVAQSCCQCTLCIITVCEFYVTTFWFKLLGKYVLVLVLCWINIEYQLILKAWESRIRCIPFFPLSLSPSVCLTLSDLWAFLKLMVNYSKCSQTSLRGVWDHRVMVRVVKT